MGSFRDQYARAYCSEMVRAPSFNPYTVGGAHARVLI